MDDRDSFDPGPDEGMALPAWEERDRYGFLNALYLTIRQVLLSPGPFFARMPSALGFVQPLFFALSTGVIGFFLLWMWQLTLSSMQFVLVDNLTGWMSGPVATGVLWILSPVWIVLTVYSLAGIVHGCLALLGANRLGFEATFRVVAYSCAALVLLVLPFCGSVVALGWMLAVMVIGLQKVHEAETWRAVTAVALPALFCLLSCSGLFMLLMGLKAFVE